MTSGRRTTYPRGMSNATSRGPGWYEDANRPGIERYWDGRGWADDVAPRATPDPVWKKAQPIVLAVVIVLAGVFFLYWLARPSSADCSLQQLEVATGERAAVDSACVGR